VPLFFFFLRNVQGVSPFLRIFTAIVVLLALAVIGITAYQQYPRNEPYISTIMHWVPEMKTRQETKKVTVNGQEVEVTVEVPYTVQMPVYETKTNVHEPDKLEWLKTYFIIGVGIFLTLWACITLFAYGRDKVTNARPNANTKDTQKQIEKLASFATGVALGFIGGGGLLPKAPPPNRDEIGQVDSQPNESVMPAPAPMIPWQNPSTRGQPVSPTMQPVP